MDNRKEDYWLSYNANPNSKRLSFEKDEDFTIIEGIKIFCIMNSNKP